MQETLNNSPASGVYRVETVQSQVKRRIILSLLLLILVAVVATVGLLHLHHHAWVEQGEVPGLWDCMYALLEGLIPFSVAQYVAAAGAFALAWVLWLTKWRRFCYLLIAWGITWLPVAVISTGDITASSGGPFNFPMSMFATPFFGVLCLFELGLALLFWWRTARSKIDK